MPVGVVLVAAGRGARFGSNRPKQFLPLAGRPLLYWPLNTFERTPAVRSVVVVARPRDIRRVRTLVRRWRFRKVSGVVAGGRERADSVRAGLRSLNPDLDVVLVHDAARPLVTREVVERVIGGARRSGAALAAWPVPDTLKRQRAGARAGAVRVRETVPRNGLWLAQTPQGFRRDVAEAFLRKGGRAFTDDVQALERTGRPVELVLGSPRNLKVTLPDDLKICEALLKDRRRGK